MNKRLTIGNEIKERPSATESAPDSTLGLLKDRHRLPLPKLAGSLKPDSALLSILPNFSDLLVFLGAESQDYFP